ncbi:hypothetical protein B0A49_08974 [Cryomyces minteri]|uniref:EXPERA domain-containing protein n=1 Tax=Cryomyces minteri TaxID=331657 RepID=A0A4U0WGZ8_9PEZI|nr:hypothetical protein B0A49_08974 [Cryomyces minteri]
MKIDTTTVLSLLSTVALLLIAYITSLRLLPRAARKIRVLYIWHLFDALTHFIFEGSFLWNCFCVYSTSSRIAPTSGLLSTLRSALTSAVPGDPAAKSPFLPPTRLWQEYARADRRWGGVDLTVVSLELLTVCVAGPMALWICEMLRRREVRGEGMGRRVGSGKVWFWMVVLATGELYGGFMTFAPEWLSGSPNLDTSNFMYTWVYLFFFNTLWVWFPLWVLFEAYQNINGAFAQTSGLARQHEKLT